MVQGSAGDEERRVGGELTHALRAEGPGARFELLRRSSDAPIDWTFRQPRAALFWYGAGVGRMALNVAGRRFALEPTAASNFALFPAGAPAGGRFEIASQAEYAVVFFEDELVHEVVGRNRDRPLIGFGDEALQSRMRRLRREAVSADPTFGFVLHGWALQALETVARDQAGDQPSPRPRAGGLSPRRLARATDYMTEHLASASCWPIWPPPRTSARATSCAPFESPRAGRRSSSCVTCASSARSGGCRRATTA